jgi:hypothetical protein
MLFFESVSISVKSGWKGFVAPTRLGAFFPLPRTDLAYGHGMGYAKSCEAV